MLKCGEGSFCARQFFVAPGPLELLPAGRRADLDLDRVGFDAGRRRLAQLLVRDEARELFVYFCSRV